MKHKDKLKNKDNIRVDYISRYANFPYYYHSLDEKYIQGITGHLKSEAYVEITLDFSSTLDSLAYKYYGRPDYWWVIADFNRITDPFLPLFPKYKTLKVPSITSIEFSEVRK